jgi:MFS family permease
MGMAGGAAGNHTSPAVVIGDYNPQCAIPEVESATAMLNLWWNLIAGILAAIAAPFWGKVSDQYGRLKPLAAASTVILASEVIIVLIATDLLSLNWVYLTFVLERFRFVLYNPSAIPILIESQRLFHPHNSPRMVYAADCTHRKDCNVALG